MGKNAEFYFQKYRKQNFRQNREIFEDFGDFLCCPQFLNLQAFMSCASISSMISNDFFFLVAFYII